MSDNKERRRVRSYDAQQVLQVDINAVLHRLYLDAKASEELADWTAEEDYKLGDNDEQTG